MDVRFLSILDKMIKFFEQLFTESAMTQSLLIELKQLLVEGLHLEDIKPEDIDADEPLFGEGLGLDSIDALEIAVLLDKKYGVRISSGDERNVDIFSSLNALAGFIEENRVK